MTPFQLALRTLWHDRRRQIGVVAAAAVTCVVLVGALVVGDSVRHTLQRRAAARIGQIEVVLDAGDRFVRAALAEAVATRLGGVTVAPVLRASAVVSTPDSTARAVDTQLLGVDARFWQLAPVAIQPPAPGEVFLNRAVARQLRVVVGQSLVFRMPRPTALPRDVPLGADDRRFAVLRLEVAAILDDEQFGTFALRSAAISPWNAFVHPTSLSEKLDRTGRANLLLIGRNAATPHGGAALRASQVEGAVRQAWQLEDLQLRLVPQGSEGQWTLSSDRIFLDHAIAEMLDRIEASPQQILTYFVNRIEHAGHETPYSMVASMDLASLFPASSVPGFETDIETGIVLNDWLAHDLDAGVGDTVVLSYYAMGQDRRLEERQASFRVVAVVPMVGEAADPTLAPRIPGLSDAADCRDWRPGIEIDLARIRDKDEAYWDRHRTTPKAFLSLRAGQRLWENLYGNLTAVRFQEGDGEQKRFAQRLLAAVKPGSMGLRVAAVRADATATVDFSHLFLGMSFFIIVAALVLVGFQFSLSADARGRHMGFLLAIGWSRGRVLRTFAAEGWCLAVGGTLVGLPFGVLYPRAVVAALNTIWHGAVGGTEITFVVTPKSLLFGAAMATVVAGIVTTVVVWRRLCCLPRQLLDRLGVEQVSNQSSRRWALGAWSAVGFCYLVAVLIVIMAGAGRGIAASAAFFGAGAITLCGNLVVARCLLAVRFRRSSRSDAMTTFFGLARRRLGRRPGRAMATIVTMALGAFLLGGINNARLSPLAEAGERDSGTGGFALWAESTVPVTEDLNDPSVQNALGVDMLSTEDGFAVVPLRVRDGDDASCLNLDTAQIPQILGVDGEALSERDAFRFTGIAPGRESESGWALLQGSDDPRVVPGIVDQATLQWGLQKRLGDLIAFTDAHGHSFHVRIVATIADSILQGSVLIDRSCFADRFSDEAGSRAFLIDAGPGRAADVSAGLTAALADYGFHAALTVDRLAALYEVQNTYLSIFQVLGAIGMVLGCFGLAAVVWRNVTEQRGELAVMHAVGFSRGTLQRLVLLEHLLMLVAGVLAGVLAAVIAVIPTWRTEGTHVPWMVSWVTLGLMLICGGAAVWLAVRVALRGSLMEGMREA